MGRGTRTPVHDMSDSTDDSGGENEPKKLKRKSKWPCWKTNQMVEEDDPWVALKELVIYIPYIIITCILAFSMVSQVEYRYTDAIKSILEDGPLRPDTGDYHEFVDIMSVADVWDWLEGPMIDTLYPTSRYNGEKLSAYESRFIVQESKLLGAPRLRMLKVKNGSCEVPKDFRDEIFGCFGPYASGIEDRFHFPASIYANASDLVFTNESAWTYQSQAELDGLPLRVSDTEVTYGGGGFVQLLPVNQSDAVATIAELKAGRWISEGTRVVFLDFTVYNANINLFCVVKYVFEFPASGGVSATSQFRTIKLIRYVDSYDYFVMACEIVFVLFVLYYTIEEALELYSLGCYKYFTSNKWQWQVLDDIILVCSYISIFFYAYRTALVNNTLDDLIKDDTTYANFELVSVWQTSFNLLIALTLFLSWIKTFKYLSFNPTMYQMSQTLSQAAQDILGYTVMFLIVFFAFAQLGYLVFSSDTFGFHTFGDTVFTLFRIILGDFDFYALQQSHPVFGPIYFVVYVFVVFFILVNVFLAIINDSYINVKDKLKSPENQHQFKLAELMSKKWRALFRLKRKKAVHPNLEDGPSIERVSPSEPGTRSRRGSARGDRLARSARERASRTSIGGVVDSKIEGDVQKLNDRVIRLEEAMGSTIAKIDAILVHLENIEHAQRKAAGFDDDTDNEGLIQETTA
eukprot:m.107400 g.107400  ORF g.107400 m.107400 type:complete len:688 (+) comp27793_c1_seq1:310-2373(+)